ncbi:hypothetical protein AYI68_g4516 [Smittium mucronatum]|uniref:Uncharacterized protein n=1 Tax=Smittium mucronatum TaxID=133383 RepID=A0A1R0GWV2_9FUNG|nr:hypothetical protein AYI68_g4516 [Smittium mucronatum]
MPISEEGRNTAIYTCPRTSSMSYTPPPLNDSSSTAVNKVDAVLHAIQAALSRATRPIDFYFHRRLQEHPGIMISDNPDVIFANKIRVLISDIATQITQNRIENLHKGIELPGKVQKIFEIDTKPLIDQETFDALLAIRKTGIRKRRFQPFRKFQQATVTLETASSKDVTVQNSSAAYTSIPKNREPNRDSNGPSSSWAPIYVQSGISQIKEQPLDLGNSGKWIQNPIKRSNISQVKSVVGENENSTDRCRLFAEGEELGPKCRQINVFTYDGFDAAEGAGTLSTSGGPFEPKAYVLPTSVQTETDTRSKQGSQRGKFSRVLQNSFRDTQEDRGAQISSRSEEAKFSFGRKEIQNRDPSRDMQNDTNEVLHEVSVFGRWFHARFYPQVMQEIPHIMVEWKGLQVSGPSIRTTAQSPYIYQGDTTNIEMGSMSGNRGIGVQDKFKEIDTCSLANDFSSRDSYKLKGYDAKSTTIQGQRYTQGSQQASENCCTVTRSPNAEEVPRSEEQLNTEFGIMERTTKNMERDVLPSGVSGIGDIHGLQRQEMEGGGSDWNQIILWNMESLRCIDAYQYQGYFNNIIRVAATESFREIGIELSSLQLVQMAEPLRLPALEPYIPGSPEGQERKVNYDSHCPIIEAGGLVSRSQRAFNEPATAIIGYDGGARP